MDDLWKFFCYPKYVWEDHRLRVWLWIYTGRADNARRLRAALGVGAAQDRGVRVAAGDAPAALERLGAPAGLVEAWQAFLEAAGSQKGRKLEQPTVEARRAALTGLVEAWREAVR